MGKTNLHCTVLCSSCAVTQILKLGLTFIQKGEQATLISLVTKNKLHHNDRNYTEGMEQVKGI